MAEYTFDAKVAVTDEMIDTLLTNLEIMRTGWLEQFSDRPWGNVIVFWWLEDESDPETMTSKKLTRKQIAEGLAEVAFGRGARTDLIQHAQRAILEVDAGEIDGEISDCAIQYALFDEIVYG